MKQNINKIQGVKINYTATDSPTVYSVWTCIDRDRIWNEFLIWFNNYKKNETNNNTKRVGRVE